MSKIELPKEVRDALADRLSHYLKTELDLEIEGFGDLLQPVAVDGLGVAETLVVVVRPEGLGDEAHQEVGVESLDLQVELLLEVAAEPVGEGLPHGLGQLDLRHLRGSLC